jgi:hypothetical protein
MIVLAALVVSVVLVGGCGGHGGIVPPGGGGVGVAAFVGRTVCAACHSDIDADFGSYWNGTEYVPFHPDGTHAAYATWENFKGSAHGQDMRSKGPGNRDVLTNGCGTTCHTVGWQEPTGFTSTAQTPHLEGIGCEECHGTGSLHAGDPSTTNINRVPDDKNCWDCHVPSYKLLDTPVPTVTDATYYNTNPGSVSPHFRQAPFLFGFEGYNLPQMASPHSLVDNTCVTCHLNENSADKHGEDALEPDFTACGPCHGSPGAAQTLLAAFDEEIEELLIELAGESSPGVPNSSPTGGLIGAYATNNGIVLNSNNQKDLQVVKNYKAARNNWYLVEGGCPVHNPDFARKLLEDAKALVD